MLSAKRCPRIWFFPSTPLISKASAMRTHSRGLSLSLLAVAAVLPVSAQQYYGGITGTVTDSSGAIVPELTLVITNLNKGTVTRVATNDAGVYRVLSLTPDPYRVDAEAAGFKRFVRERVLVEMNRIVTLDIALEVGASTETITVSGAAPILDTETAASTSTVSNAVVNATGVLNLGRFRSDTGYYLMQLPGSASGSPNQERISGAQLSVYGTRSSQVGWDEDGLPNKSPANGAHMHLHSVANESMESFRYTLVNASADSATPGRVSIVTQSGTNTLHGSVYLNAHNSWFDANDHNAPARSKKPVAKHYYKGYNVSGPVFLPKLYDGRNRTFFMASLEMYRAPASQTSFLTVPTAAMRKGDLSDYRDAAGKLIVVNDPLTGIPFPNNTIATARIYPGAGPWMDKVLPLPNVPTALASNNAFGAWLVQNTDQNRWDFRFDQTINSRHNMFFRANYLTYLSRYRYYATGENLSKWSFNTYQVNYMATLRPNLLNEVRFGMNQIPNVVRTGVTSKEGATLLGVQGIPEVLYGEGRTTYPSVSITGFSGASQLGDNSTNNRMWNIFDNLTCITGAHTLKVGVDFRLGETKSIVWPTPGRYSFNGTFSGAGLGDFLLGIPYSSVRDYPRAAFGETILRNWSTSWYVQDDWKVSPRLTVNLGVRWDANLPGREVNDLYYNIDPATGDMVVPNDTALGKIVPTFPKTVKAVTASQAGFPKRLRNSDLNNITPRIGLAWRLLDAKSVLRVAYGIYTDSLSLNYIPTAGPWGGSETFINRIVSGALLWRWPAAFPAGVVGQTPGTAVVSGFDQHIRNPYVQQWNATIERQVGEILVRWQYVGTKGTQLYWYRELNVPAPSTIPFTDARRPFPQYGGMNYRTNGGNSIYHGMTLGGERRLRHGVTFNSFWTWSRLMTDSYDGGGESNSLPVGFWYPTFDRSRWRGNQNFNPKHRWTSLAYVELPFGKGKRYGANWSRAMNALAGGWALSGYANMETGWYVSPYYSAGNDTAGVNTRSGIPDRIGHGVLNNQGLHPGDFFLDRSAFVMPAANIGRFGTSGINFMQEPSWWRFDASVEKTFPIHERVGFQFRCHIINPLNHAVWGHGSFKSGLDMSNPVTFGTMAGKYVSNRMLAFEGRLAW